MSELPAFTTRSGIQGTGNLRALSLIALALLFLQAGGEIQKIAKGVSGQVYGPSRQITISKKR